MAIRIDMACITLELLVLYDVFVSLVFGMIIPMFLKPRSRHVGEDVYVLGAYILV